MRLMRALQEPSTDVLQQLTDITLELCRAQSAGVCIAEQEHGHAVFRWYGAAGAWSSYRNETVRRQGSPWDLVLNLNMPLLMARPEREFHCGMDDLPPLVELLLVPLRSQAGIVGAVCVGNHDERRHFDREDLRLLSSMSEFAAVADQVLRQAGRIADALAKERASSQLLQAISSELVHQNDVNLLYGQILEAAIGIVRSALASMQVLRGAGELQLLAWRGLHPGTVRSWRQLNMQSLRVCAQALQRKQRVIIADTELCELLSGSAELLEYRRCGIRSMQATPLISHSGSLLGVIATHWREPHESTPDELRLFDVLARLAADLLERAMRQERQAFLLRLSDELRALDNPSAVQGRAMQLLGEHLSVDRAAFALLDSDHEVMSVASEWRRGDAPSAIGHYPTDEFRRRFMACLRKGAVAVIEDACSEPPRPEDSRTLDLETVYRRAAIACALVNKERFTGAIFVDQHTPRQWTETEIATVREVGERTWEASERARAEVARRDSEERFRKFADASSDVLWIRNAATLALEYASPAVQTVFGVLPEGIIGEPGRWGALVVPDDREAALQRLEETRRGEAVVHEFRIQRPSDRSFRWIRSTDFPLFDEQGRVQRVAGIASDITELRRSADHQAVLVAELQHRVRNIMAMIRSISRRTAEGAQSVPDYGALMEGRLLTLARVQTLLTRAANKGVGIRDIVREQLSAQAQPHSQFEIVGENVLISPKAAEVITLAIHELATNALKYGALSVPEGRIAVKWDTEERQTSCWLSLDWLEHVPQGVSQPSRATRRNGFGTELIECRVPYELGGRGELTIEPGGARCHLEFPLAAGASVLETDAPKAAQISGGSPQRPVALPG